MLCPFVVLPFVVLLAKKTTKKKVNRSPLVRVLLMVIRRSHLYFGLLLV